MDVRGFRAGGGAATGLSAPLRALWQEAQGDWKRAHQIVQDEDDRDSAWVHAYLHRREGDLPNAGYWYRRAGRPVEQAALDEEWEAIVAALLAARASA
jgi:hypothetical protein